jgi:ribosomal protein S18 acetylase RimI-like enzyme
MSTPSRTPSAQASSPAARLALLGCLSSGCTRTARAGRRTPLPPRRAARAPAAAAAAEPRGFHQARLAADAAAPKPAAPPLAVEVRVATRDDELEAAAWLRARSFYAYNPEREFAGRIHQAMVAEEELGALKEVRARAAAAAGAPAGAPPPAERSACLVALAAPAGGEGGEGGEGGGGADADAEFEARRLRVSDDGAAFRLLAGTLDLHAARALPGEALIGGAANAAYLANVCAARSARRRGVGEALLREARALARAWGVEALYVHALAVNAGALAFYAAAGFVVEREESANAAHYRGRCLDGEEGRGRSVLLRDTRL